MIAAGIDPGNPFGWALVELPGNRIITAGQGGRAKREEAMDEIACVYIGDQVLAVAAVEDQFIIDDRRMQTAKRRGLQASTIKLAHDAGEWAMFLRWRARVVEYVHPSKWRAAYGKQDWSKESAKETSVTLAAQIFKRDLKPSEHHMAEALLIARWAGIEALQRERTG